MNLGDRMKEYEISYKTTFTNRLPVIMRLDGKAFHTLTNDDRIEKPFDKNLVKILNITFGDLMEEIQGAVFGYTQSDEMSILLYPWKCVESQAWFGNEMNKINSVSAGIASALATQLWNVHFDDCNLVTFDCRSFVLPHSEVVNYFIWRQQDWIRNSVQMLGRQYFSQNELHGCTNDHIKTMLEVKGVLWNELPADLKYGRAFYKNDKGTQLRDDNIPIFTENREFILKHFSSNYA